MPYKDIKYYYIYLECWYPVIHWPLCSLLLTWHSNWPEKIMWGLQISFFLQKNQKWGRHRASSLPKKCKQVIFFQSKHSHWSLHHFWFFKKQNEIWIPYIILLGQFECLVYFPSHFKCTKIENIFNVSVLGQILYSYLLLGLFHAFFSQKHWLRLKIMYFVAIIFRIIDISLQRV